MVRDGDRSPSPSSRPWLSLCSLLSSLLAILPSGFARVKLRAKVMMVGVRV